MQNKAILTIGLPVYNGEKYLAEAIESILAQTFTNFNLIVSDNASTDKTEEICASYIKKDARIKYIKNDKNYGAAYNHNKVFEMSSTKYFKWIACDDIHSPTFIEKCINVLENHSEIVLVYLKSANIGPNGKFLEENCFNLKGNSDFANKRFDSFINIDHNSNSIFGIIRRSALVKTDLLRNFLSGDRMLLAQLALLGKFYEIPEVLFFWRRHENSSTIAYDYYNRTEWWDTKKANSAIFPHWRLFKEYFASVIKSRISIKEKLLCFCHLIKWIGWKKKGMKKDVDKYLLNLKKPHKQIYTGKEAINENTDFSRR